MGTKKYFSTKHHNQTPHNNINNTQVRKNKKNKQPLVNQSRFPVPSACTHVSAAHDMYGINNKRASSQAKMLKCDGQSFWVPGLQVMPSLISLAAMRKRAVSASSK